MTSGLEVSNGSEFVSFGFERLRSYIFTIKAQDWSGLEVEATIGLIGEASKTRLGREAIEFYIEAVDRGTTSLLRSLALVDLDLFISIVSSSTLRSPLANETTAEARTETFISRVIEYVETYSLISRYYFPELSEKIVPHNKGDVGVWVSQDFSVHQLRIRTDKYPHLIVSPDNETVGLLIHGHIQGQIYDDLMPDGPINMGGFVKLERNLPQQVALSELRSELQSVFEHRLLDEQKCPCILSERIWKILMERPIIWAENEPNIKKKYYQSLGYSNPNEIIEDGLDANISKVSDLLTMYLSLLDDPSYGQIHHVLRRKGTEILNLAYLLTLLNQQGMLLSHRPYQLSELVSYVKHGLEASIETVEALAPIVFECYSLIAKSSFSSHLISKLDLHNHIDCNYLIEINRERQGDLALGYVRLPDHIKLPRKFIGYIPAQKEQALFNQLLTQETGYRKSQVRGGRFGIGKLSLNIDGQQIRDETVHVNFVRFPSYTPVLDQVYGLLGNEIRFLFGVTGLWTMLETGRNLSDKYDDWVWKDFVRITNLKNQ